MTGTETRRPQRPSLPPGTPPSRERVTFRQFVTEQIAAATAAAEAHEKRGRSDLAETWRGRVRDLQAYLDDRLAQTRPAPGVT